MRTSHVYILTNKNQTLLFTGITSNLVKRMYQHRTKFFKGSTSRYNCDPLIIFGSSVIILDAIVFEKKLKAGNRARKEKLINEMNSKWKDLPEGWVFDKV